VAEKVVESSTVSKGKWKAVPARAKVYGEVDGPVSDLLMSSSIRANIYAYCKGTSVHILTLSPLLSPINSYSTPCICTSTPTPVPIPIVDDIRISSCRPSTPPSAHTSATSDKYWIHGDMSTRYYGTLRVTWTHGKERLRGLVLYRTLY
jgi:hypothetical protein